MIVHRQYDSYEDYVDRQGGKASKDTAFLLRHLEKKTGWWEREFRRASGHLIQGPMLCLGARTGAENIGAVRAGFRGSEGIDLHPVGPSVVRGDWHALPIEWVGRYTTVFCNSLDHCFHLGDLCLEVKRVLAPDGRFYVMATNRPGQTAERWLRGKGHEALYWDTSDELRDAICAQGFRVTAEWHKGKWGHYIFEVTK